MEKLFTLLCFFCAATMALPAQSILSEDFETSTSMPPAGWSVVDSNIDTLHWTLVSDKQALSGTKSAYCDASTFAFAVPQKEEWLISPELKLDDKTYKVEFLWLGATAQSINKVNPEYDFQVRVSTDGGSSWDTVWSFLNEEQVFNSGVSWPWQAWNKNKSIVNLSNYKGKSIKIAFVHCLLIEGVGKGNCIKLDDIKVEPYTPIETPVVDGNQTYTFENVYIGAFKYSEPLYIRNSGIGTLEVLSVTGLDGTDYSTNIEPSKVVLRQNEEYAYNVIYTPTLEGARTATLKIETNGGTLEVNLSGSKIMLEDNYTFESFEGDVFPPLGWTADRGWSRYNGGISGNFTAYCSFSETNPALTTPRLDLSTGTHFLEFEMLEQYDSSSDYSARPENELFVYFSSDGGNTWQRVDESNLELNEIVHVNINLGEPKSDNCYIKFVYNYDGTITSWDEMPEWSIIFIDDVILPPLYGTLLPPVAATQPTPTNSAADIYPEDVELSWSGVQFADGYKLYLYKQGEATGNAIELGTQTTYTCPRLDYATTYEWKVVPYNSYGECADVPTWQFTTQADYSINQFPVFEGFESNVFPPMGWRVINGTNAQWYATDNNAYDGQYSALANGNANNTVTTLQTPAITLPEGKNMQVCFYWGNRNTVSLTKKPALNFAPAVAGSDTLYFDIKGNNGVWKTLASTTSESRDDNEKWLRERIVLTDYAGQTISLRWRYSVANSMRSTGASLDNITIEEAPTQGKAVLSTTKWDAGEVNYKKAILSPVFTLLNDGETSITVKEVKFTTENFSTSLTESTTIAPREESTFNIQFSALETAAAVNDVMTVTFENAETIELPVCGTALAGNIRYFSFDEDTFGSTTPKGFTTVDRDGYATVSPIMINYPNIGTPYAYIVINQKPEPEGADWRNIYPRSGDQMLAAMSPDGYDSGRKADDWIISEPMKAQENARFRFYAKSYSLDNYFDFATLSVHVSTTDNKLSSFVAVPSFSNVLLTGLADHYLFNEFIVDLSQYAGQTIYVALQHTVSDNGFVTFFDDFYFENFDFQTSESAPVFMTTAPQAATIGKEYVYNFAAYDADGDTLTFSTIGLPNWLSMTAGAFGGTISGTPTQEGEYLFRINATDGAHFASQEVMLTVSHSGITATAANALRIYPNPATDYILLEGMTGDAVVSLYDLTGSLILRQKSAGQLDVSALPSGTYILKVEGNTANFTARIIKR